MNLLQSPFITPRCSQALLLALSGRSCTRGATLPRREVNITYKGWGGNSHRLSCCRLHRVTAPFTPGIIFSIIRRLYAATRHAVSLFALLTGSNHIPRGFHSSARVYYVKRQISEEKKDTLRLSGQNKLAWSHTIINLEVRQCINSAITL